MVQETRRIEMGMRRVLETCKSRLRKLHSTRNLQGWIENALSVRDLEEWTQQIAEYKRPAVVGWKM